MREISIIAVSIENKEVVVSLFGGIDNVVGTLRFFEKDDIKRHELRRRAEKLMNGNVLVDLAVSWSTGRWRLLGKNREVVGGLEPTKLEISQTLKPSPPPKKEDKGGLGWPEAWGEEE